MSTKGRGLGYELRTQRAAHGQGFETLVVFSCRRCPATLTLHQRKNPDANNPEFVAKKAREHGWLAHPNKPNRTRCPACLGDDVQDAEPITHVDLTDATIIELTAIEEPATMNSPPPSAKVTPLASAIANSSSLTPMIKAMAPDTKTRIRNMLDKHFDDSKGRYLDGYSDQRIGVELDVPWKTVADMREIAYGPIKEDPELMEIKAAIETMSVKLGDRIAEFIKWTESQRGMIDDLRRRVIVCEQRRDAS